MAAVVVAAIGQHRGLSRSAPPTGSKNYHCSNSYWHGRLNCAPSINHARPSPQALCQQPPLGCHGHHVKPLPPSRRKARLSADGGALRRQRMPPRARRRVQVRRRGGLERWHAALAKPDAGLPVPSRLISGLLVPRPLVIGLLDAGPLVISLPVAGPLVANPPDAGPPEARPLRFTNPLVPGDRSRRHCRHRWRYRRSARIETTM